MTDIIQKYEGNVRIEMDLEPKKTRREVSLLFTKASLENLKIGGPEFFATWEFEILTKPMTLYYITSESMLLSAYDERLKNKRIKEEIMSELIELHAAYKRASDDNNYKKTMYLLVDEEKSFDNTALLTIAEALVKPYGGIAYSRDFHMSVEKEIISLWDDVFQYLNEKLLLGNVPESEIQMLDW